MFEGFTEAASDFLWGIRFNNEREWFLDHKQTYLTQVQTPLKELAGEVFERFHSRHEDLDLELHVSRIYRDARRLHGRGPYKDHLWFCVEQPAEAWTAKPTFWFELAPDNWSYGMGYWMPKPLTMAKLRARIDRDPGTREKLMRGLGKQTEFSLGTTDYTRPRSEAPSQILKPWYQMKSFSIGHEDKLTDELFSREIVDRLKTGYEFLLPYYDYFVTLDADPDPSEGK